MKKITRRMAQVYKSMGRKVKKTKNCYYLMEVHD
jgi:hypothetical protein